MQALLPSFLGQVLRCTRQRLVPATSQLWLHSIRYSSKLGRVVFLGTPGFAAQVLQDLLTDSAQAGSGFEVDITVLGSILP